MRAKTLALVQRTLWFFAGLSSGAVLVALMVSSRPVVLVEPKEGDLVLLNGCVVSACSYLASVKAQHTLQEDFWARLLLVRYKGNNAGHAYCVWETDGHIFGYDRAGGAFPIPGSVKDPLAIAASLAFGLEKVLKKPMIVQQAEFIEPAQAELHAY